MYLQKVISKTNYAKTYFSWYVTVLYVTNEKEQDSDPDPYQVYGSKDPDLDPNQKVTDPEHCQ